MRIPQRDNYRNVVFFAVIVAVTMIGLCITDLLAGYPYQPFMGQLTFDVMYLISSHILLYMCWHTWHDLELGDGPRRRQNVSNRFGTTFENGKTRRQPTPNPRTNRSRPHDRATVS